MSSSGPQSRCRAALRKTGLLTSGILSHKSLPEPPSPYLDSSRSTIFGPVTRLIKQRPQGPHRIRITIQQVVSIPKMSRRRLLRAAVGQRVGMWRRTGVLGICRYRLIDWLLSPVAWVVSSDVVGLLHERASWFTPLAVGLLHRLAVVLELFFACWGTCCGLAVGAGRCFVGM